MCIWNVAEIKIFVFSCVYIQLHFSGNDIISEFANMKPQILRIDLGDFEGATQYAQYSTFNLKGESDDYELSATDFEGDAGKSL